MNNSIILVLFLLSIGFAFNIVTVYPSYQEYESSKIDEVRCFFESESYALDHSAVLEN